MLMCIKDGDLKANSTSFEERKRVSARHGVGNRGPRAAGVLRKCFGNEGRTGTQVEWIICERGAFSNASTNSHGQLADQTTLRIRKAANKVAPHTNFKGLGLGRETLFFEFLLFTELALFKHQESHALRNYTTSPGVHGAIRRVQGMCIQSQQRRALCALYAMSRQIRNVDEEQLQMSTTEEQGARGAYASNRAQRAQRHSTKVQPEKWVRDEPHAGGSERRHVEPQRYLERIDSGRNTGTIRAQYRQELDRPAPQRTETHRHEARRRPRRGRSSLTIAQAGLLQCECCRDGNASGKHDVHVAEWKPGEAPYAGGGRSGVIVRAATNERWRPKCKVSRAQRQRGCSDLDVPEGRLHGYIIRNRFRLEARGQTWRGAIIADHEDEADVVGNGGSSDVRAASGLSDRVLRRLHAHVASGRALHPTCRVAYNTYCVEMTVTGLIVKHQQTTASLTDPMPTEGIVDPSLILNKGISAALMMAIRIVRIQT
ncbi:hypothetical protein B0H14DRAFT_2653225 [Mycena olivaceomarginata]|nr:hypothetical protein B0H14DRAFT_2653225 [Mycena olivaceomarginata]